MVQIGAKLMLPNLTIEDLALATVAAMQLVKELLIANNVDIGAIEDLAELKASDLVVNQHRDNAGNMLRIMLGARLGE